MQEDIPISKPPLIIAEAGVNHNGDIKLAFQLVDVAVEAGADIVKFQTFLTEKLTTPDSPQAKYQRRNIKKNQVQADLLRPLELTPRMHRDLIKKCKDSGIEFLSTAFDLDSLDELVKFGIKRIKIPSGEITNLPYLEKVATYGLPVILSTGMSTMKEIKDALRILTSDSLNRSMITILHCTTNYPAVAEELNMRAISAIRNELNIDVGYSDHSQGSEAAVIAVALGAKILEKHITTDRKLSGPDHAASMEPEDFINYIKAIKNACILMGDGQKKPTINEKENLLIVRKSIVASKYILKGEKFSTENLTTKRPGGGVSPMDWHSVIGKVAKQNYNKNEMIEV